MRFKSFFMLILLACALVACDGTIVDKSLEGTTPSGDESPDDGADDAGGDAGDDAGGDGDGDDSGSGDGGGDDSGSADPAGDVALSGYWTQDGRIYHDDAEIQLFGVNWFGFETSSYVVHGLWERNDEEMIAQMKELGFNAVRLPFCPTTLTGVAASSIDSGENPSLEDLNSLELLDIIMQHLNEQEMYVLFDHHRPDCSAISELWYISGYSEEDWIEDLTFIANRYRNFEYFLGIDLKNEPYGEATWGTGNADTDWNLAAEAAAAAILAVNPEILIFVEGIQENDTCSSDDASHWWGGNLEPIACYPLDIDANRLVLSPHAYGPDVYEQSYFSDAAFPANMPAIWEEHFGFLWEAGYAVVPGEFGGQYGAADARDDDWQDAFVDYLIDKNACSFFYWSWNPNSGDTGGILEDDWLTVSTGKYQNLLRLMEHCQAL